jgi:hypothetical protein
MSWMRILNKAGLTSFPSDLAEQNELEFNPLHSPVLQFLNDVGLIVVPSEILPSNPRLRRLHRSLFIVGSVTLCSLLIYMRLNEISRPVHPVASLALKSGASPPRTDRIPTAATEPAKTGRQVASARALDKPRTSLSRRAEKRSVSAELVSPSVEQQPSPTVMTLTVPRDEIPGPTVITLTAPRDEIPGPTVITFTAPASERPYCDNAKLGMYRIELCIWSKSRVEKESLISALKVVSDAIDNHEVAVSVAIEHGSVIAFLISSVGSLVPNSISIEPSTGVPEDDEILKKVVSDKEFPSVTVGDGSADRKARISLERSQ